MSKDLRLNDIRTVLLKDWDPLGVGKNPNLSDEYDSYIPELHRLLCNGATAEQVQQYLMALDVEWGGNPDVGAAKRAAKKLVDRE